MLPALGSFFQITRSAFRRGRGMRQSPSASPPRMASFFRRMASSFQERMASFFQAEESETRNQH